MTNTTLKNNFLLTNKNQAYLVQMPSKFTSLEAKSIKQLFQEFCQIGSKIPKIILDFTPTTFIDSSGLAGLCQIVQLAKNTKLKLTFGGFSPQVKIVLSLAGLEQVFTIEEDINIITSGT